MKIVPFDRSHVRRAVALHRGGTAWFYAGKKSATVLTAFYDGYANRDYTFATAAVDGDRLMAAACAATDFENAAFWFNKRRIWRDLGARLSAGAGLCRGGYAPETFAAAASSEGKKAYVVGLITAEDVDGAVCEEVFKYLMSAAASRGINYLIAAATYAPPGVAGLGFKPAAGGLLIREIR